MKVIPTNIEGLFLIEELSLTDEESFPLMGMKLDQWRFSGGGRTAFFTRTKLPYGNIRGLHFQRGMYAQNRFVSVFSGKICDVVLDIRKDSETFGQHEKVVLEAGGGRGLLIPTGCAHGFSVLSEEAEVGIWWDRKFYSQACGGVFSGDKFLNIDWGIPAGEQIRSLPDIKNPLFRNLFSPGRVKIKKEPNLK